MRALAGLCAIAIACGDTASAPPDARVALTDAPIDADCGDTCNPYDDLGCNAGDDCKLRHVDGGHGCAECVARGDVALGGACTIAGASDDCAAGGYCLDGVCRQVCGGGATPCAQGYCPFVGSAFCTLPCDPFATTATCATGEGCYATDLMTTPGCALAGPYRAGEPCIVPNECMPGLTCRFAGGAGRCTPICKLGGEPSCAPPATCTPLGTSTIYGVCVAS